MSEFHLCPWRSLPSIHGDKVSTQTRRHKVEVGDVPSSIKDTEANSEGKSEETEGPCLGKSPKQ